MKKLITFSVIVLSSLGAFITFTNETNKDNGRAGATGAPGETTCQTGGCHNGTSNTGSGSVEITSSDMTGWEYELGVTYNISVKVKETGKTIFGLGVEALNSSNANAGTINVTESTRTQILSAGGRSNLVHKSNGGLSADSSTFNFTWTAPATDVGNVTFYVAGLAGNNNNSDNGDQSYTTTKVCSAKATGVGIERNQTITSISVFPNPISDKINIDLNNQTINNASIHILDMSGKLVNTLASNISLSGNTKLSYNKPTNLNSGIYFLQISNGSVTKTSRIVIL